MKKFTLEIHKIRRFGKEETRKDEGFGWVDDTLMFLPNDMSMVINLLRILRCFELVSGLRINYTKSSIIGLNVPDQDMTSAASILNCKIDTLPFTYLGLPLARKHLPVSQYNQILENFTSHCFMESMCCFTIPSSVLSIIERNLRNFLWSGSSSTRNICKVA
ncbi:uncharacterized protein LOC126672752 [Mercurialis annua]|uniref:uncharacterized protein LOC126672752 n=1 Tax=Mercurialis annua TaxID=3986 RepID=UPI002160DC2C|nr:uncharacterized protein LOC126672752 [Mercurialis annua]